MSIADIKKNVETKMAKSVEAFKNDLQKIRTGRAHPGLLDHVQVDYYGSMVPISQVANVTLLDARTISVQPWEKGMGQKIEKAIRESDLGLNPSSMGDLIRVPMPPLTEERRRDLAKVAKGEGRGCQGGRAQPAPRRQRTSSRSWSRTRTSPRTTSVAARTRSRS